MSSAFVGRRRADQFDALVGDPTAGLDDARFAELLEVVGALRAVPAPAPRPDFSSSLRERLMAEADTVLLPRDRSVDERLALAPARPARTRRDRRLAVAAGTLAVVGATTSMAMAAQSALPGDALYPVKRALEDAQAGVSVGDGAKGTALLENASGRLAELGELARLDTAEQSAAVPATLDTFVEQAQEASQLLLEDYADSGDADSIAELRDFAAASMAALTDLGPLLPTSARDELRMAAKTLAKIDELAARLCPTCGGTGITEVPLALLRAASTSVDGLGSRTRILDPSASTDHSGDVATIGTVGTRGPGRPGRQRPAEQPSPQPAPDASEPADSPFGSGSMFGSPSSSEGGSSQGGSDAGASQGDGGDQSDSGSGAGGGLPDLLGGGSTGVTNDNPLDPVTEPLKPVLEPLAPLVDSVTDGLDDTLGGSLGRD